MVWLFPCSSDDTPQSIIEEENVGMACEQRSSPPKLSRIGHEPTKERPRSRGEVALDHTFNTTTYHFIRGRGEKNAT